MLKKGTRIGWLLVAISIVLTIWILVRNDSSADTTEGAFTYSDDSKTTLIAYSKDGDSSVIIPGTVNTIANDAFAGNTKITSVTIPDSVTSIEANAFQGDTSLTTVKMGSGIQSIGGNAFSGDVSLTSMRLPSSLLSIGANAFNNTALDSIEIPVGVTSIGASAFSDMQNLETIKVASGNNAYSSSDGALYNSAGTKLIFVPRAKSSITIKAGTTVIGANAMDGNENLTSITIPDSVTTIEENAFSGTGIKSVRIPKATSTIAEQSNWGIEEINGYAGSAAQYYATSHSILFRTIDEPDTPTPNPNPSDNNNTNNNTNNNGGTTATDVQNPDGSVKHADGTTTYPDGTTKDASGKVIQNTGAKHTPDNTPKTAGPIDARYFLCLSIFLAGVGFLIFSRRSKFEYVSKNKNR